MRYMLASHTTKVHDGKKYRCTHCDNKYGRVLLVSEHMFKKHDVFLEGFKKTYRCEQCSFQTLYQARLKSHMANKHAESKKVKCRVCDKMYKNEITLKCHVENIHLKMYQVTCDICQKVCGNKQQLSIHKKLKHEQPSEREVVVCPVCGKTIRTGQGMGQGPYHLNYHMIRVHGNFEMDKRPKEEHGKTVHCTFEGCDYRSLLAYDVKMHFKRAHSVKDVKCPLCDRMFSQNDKQGIRYHVLNHHMYSEKKKPPIKPLCCKSCGNKYVSKSGLMCHIANKHLGWSHEKALLEWKPLAKSRPDLWERLNVREDENAYLRGILE